MFIGTLGLVYALRHVLVLVALSLFFALLLFPLVRRGIQDYAASPLIMGRGIDIHPALVIIGVLAGGEIAGVAGMVLSVPLIAAVRIVWRRLQADDMAAGDPAPARILEPVKSPPRRD